MRSVKRKAKLEVGSVSSYGNLNMVGSATIDDMPGRYETRIFIGGNYKNQLAVILEISKFIRERARGYFIPIVATNFKMPRGEERNYCLRLLHNCKFAIFELTDPSGQLVEVERAMDYGTTCLYVCNMFDFASESHQINSMVKGGRQRVKGYRSLDNLRCIVVDQLQRWRRLTRP